jgi:hypothetical protein
MAGSLFPKYRYVPVRWQDMSDEHRKALARSSTFNAGRRTPWALYAVGGTMYAENGSGRWWMATIGDYRQSLPTPREPVIPQQPTPDNRRR